MRPTTLKALGGLAALALLPASLVGGSTVANAGGDDGHGGKGKKPKVVVDELDNPRQLAEHDGALYVAEAGRGGDSCTGEGEDEFCTGDTSKITKVKDLWKRHPRERTVIGELPSGAGPDGSFAGGDNAVGVSDRGTVYGLVSAPPDTGGPNDELAGKLFRVKKHGEAQVVADISGYEEANDPDGQGVESNPYSLLVQRKRVLVADAAGNSVLSVNREGEISEFHVFPNVTTGECKDRPNDAGTTGCDFVPTALAEGRDGSVYVTGLASEAEGEGRVVKLDRRGDVRRTWKGFTTPVGIAVQGDTFWVSELFANAEFPEPVPPETGQVTKVKNEQRWVRHHHKKHDGKGKHHQHRKHDKKKLVWVEKRSSQTVPLPAGLVFVGKKLYVSAYSVAPSTGLFGNPDWNGQVWRIRS